MDMYEHSDPLDFGASVQPYIDAFFRNANWDVMNARLARAERAARELRRS
jgi:Fe-Mn family superoxide dismutase